jgi:hypothetical protein
MATTRATIRLNDICESEGYVTVDARYTGTDTHRSVETYDVTMPGMDGITLQGEDAGSRLGLVVFPLWNLDQRPKAEARRIKRWLVDIGLLIRQEGRLVPSESQVGG